MMEYVYTWENNVMMALPINPSNWETVAGRYRMQYQPTLFMNQRKGQRDKTRGWKKKVKKI